MSQSVERDEQQQEDQTPSIPRIEGLSLGAKSLVTEFVSECQRRNIPAPTAIIHSLANAADTTEGIFEIQEVMLPSGAVEALMHSLSCYFGPNNTNSETGEYIPLKQLSMRNAYVGDTGVLSILRFLIKFCASSIEVVELPGNSLQESCGEIATTVSVLTSLRKLVLDWNKIGSASSNSSSVLSSNKENNNKINASSAAATAAAGGGGNNNSSSSSSAPSAQERVSAAAGIVPSASVHRLLQALTQHHSIEHVSLQNNLLGKSCVEDVCSLITNSKTLEYLDLSWNSLGETGGSRVANAVAKCTSDKLRQLEIQGNGFARKDCEMMDRKLRSNREVEARELASRQQEDELKNKIESLQREANDLRNMLSESNSRLAANDMILSASKESETTAKKEKIEFEKAMREAQDKLRTEQLSFTQRVDDERTRCSAAIEHSSKRLHEAVEQADQATMKSRVKVAEMDAEVTQARERKLEAEREASGAKASAAAASQAMEKIQAEHTIVQRSLTESRQRIAELEMQLKVRDDELDRQRATASAHGVDLEAAKSTGRQLQEQNESLKLRVKDLEYNLEQAEKKRSEELRTALLRAENEQKDEVASAQRATKHAEQEKLQTEKTMVELKAQFESTRRHFENQAQEANSLADKTREKCQQVELELEKTMSKCSLLEIEASRSESRAKAAEERAKLLQNELQSSMQQHKQRIEELAQDFEHKLSDKDTECQDRSRECRVLAEEVSLIKAKFDAVQAKMRQTQVDLEKRVVKSLRTAMLDVQHNPSHHHHHHSRSGSGYSEEDEDS